MIEVDLSNPWLAIVVGVFVLSALVTALIARRAPRTPGTTDAKLDALDRRMAAADRRMAVHERQLKDADHDLRQIRMVIQKMPTQESIHAIGMKVEESRGKIETMQGTLNGQTKQLDLILECLVRTSIEAMVAPKNTGETK